MEFPYKCWNCKDDYTRIRPSGLCAACDSLKQCKKCRERVKGVDKTGICWNCQGRLEALRDKKLESAGQ